MILLSLLELSMEVGVPEIGLLRDQCFLYVLIASIFNEYLYLPFQVIA